MCGGRRVGALQSWAEALEQSVSARPSLLLLSTAPERNARLHEGPAQDVGARPFRSVRRLLRAHVHACAPDGVGARHFGESAVPRGEQNFLEVGQLREFLQHALVGHGEHEAIPEVLVEGPNAATQRLGSPGLVLSAMASKAARSPMAAALHSMMAFTEKVQRTRRLVSSSGLAQKASGTSKTTSTCSKKLEKQR